MSAPPRFLSPFVRTRTRLTLTLGLVLAALTAALLPWWLPDDSSGTQAGGAGPAHARRAATGPRDTPTAVAAARRTGKDVVVDTETTATSMTWARPDGRLRTRINALPVRAKNADGTWAPVDNRLHRTKNASHGLGVRPANPALPVRFSSGTPGKRADRSHTRTPLAGTRAAGETVLAEVDLAGHTVAYTWPGTLPEPVLDGPRALYPEVLPGVDLLLVAREEGGFAQLLIVKTPEAARNKALATVSYGLRSQTAAFRYDESAGQVRVVDKAGKELGAVPAPFGWDSSGRDPELTAPAAPHTSVATPADVLKLSGLSGVEPGAHSARLPLHVDGDRTGTARLDLRIGESDLLTGKGVRFPVFVDPTLHGPWDGWTVAYKPYPNTSFWDGTNFSSGTSDARVGYESDSGGTARSFWRMKYSTSLKGATISSATFKVLNNHSWSCTTREFQFWLTGAISSGTTWNKQPSWSTLLQKKSFAHGWSSSSCPDDYEAFDVKDAAQKGADSGWSNITFGMRATSESDAQTWRKFQATSAQLDVVYNRKPNEPTKGTSSPGGTCSTSGVTVGKTNIVLSANATDPDGNLSKLEFRFWKSGDSTPDVYPVTPNSSGTATTTIPTTYPLTDKAVYYWDVRSKDSGSPALYSTYFPANTADPCKLTVDGSGPSQAEITSTDYPQATDDGLTWSKNKFGDDGSVTFSSPGAVKFTYAFEQTGYTTVNANSSGTATIATFHPPHAGPNWLNVYAYDAAGNPSVRADYNFFVPPRDKADGPGDITGDRIPDLLTVTASGVLRNCVGSDGGELYSCMDASYTADGTMNPPNHWYDPATGKAALITHFEDAYPGDGLTDLFAVTPDGKFWLYPGDGYGTFNVDQRLGIRLPANAPDPANWTQIKAVGDITGDKRTDLVLRSGPEFWLLSGYSGASFQSATLMNVDAWARRDIVNVADINGDQTPDLLWRNLDNGTMYLRQGKPGASAGTVDPESLKLGANSLSGKDESYGTNWADTNISTALGIPDINKDGIPDLWVRSATDGQMRLYNPSRTNTGGAVKVVLSSDWRTVKALG
ncbi:DNRLRE domain-containing protein [Streptomyces sp. NPDC090023]|uniref:DNRLRE domain-containing protein n=1 Tax=unclassified Streptomyces TaxID=2593676 RepID=UPI0037F99BBE